jgi:uncharacterized protein YeeX (DUF496 family)
MDQTSMLLRLSDLEKRIDDEVVQQNTTLMKEMFEKGKSLKTMNSFYYC